MKSVDKSSPPEKGSFEYKTDKYGRIFSQEEIGKYSSKIAKICKCILESEGIVLIYSEYIDAGLIPVALALEEMGFQRSSVSGARSLFATPPKKILLDSQTMKPRERDGKAGLPACYAMVTGDPRLSPSNEDEVKALTSDNNADGHRIKVLLISRAGSEGVDFKFIRQIHILEPWYNMNRIEQIIGRGVRNLSHRELPFEKRNVSIYLHATFLEENKEEAADLYVYRVAEYKAVQMGRVSRVLKETAVDCILNHDQTNFTMSNMNMVVEQILPDGRVLKDFRIGDIPYSATCDYMSSCEFKCRPGLSDENKITDANVNNETYNEAFIIMNSDKILQKIRDLMKERFFYKKKDLITMINIPKPYPLVQIYSALTHILEDSNEVLVDKYGRTGHLVNIGEYYLFQPSELNYSAVSLYDRSVPIDYKHSMIEIDLKKVFQTQSQLQSQKQNQGEGERKREKKEKKREEETKQEEEEETKQEEEDKIDGKTRELIETCITEFDLAFDFMKVKNLPRGQEEWYKHCGFAMEKLERINEIDPSLNINISLSQMQIYAAEHMIEFLSFDNKLLLLHYVTNLSNINDRTTHIFLRIAKEYFENKTLRDNGITGIILFHHANKKRKLYLLESVTQRQGQREVAKTFVWREGEAEDERDLSQAIRRKYAYDPSKYSQFIGFIDYDKSYVFKVKDTLMKRTTGARCEQATKAKNIASINNILKASLSPEVAERIGNVFTKDNIKPLVDTGVCYFEEFLLRHFQREKRNNKVWFLDPDTAKFQKL